MATLTGAQANATGKLIAAVLCNNDDSELEVIKAGKKSGDLGNNFTLGRQLLLSWAIYQNARRVDVIVEFDGRSWRPWKVIEIHTIGSRLPKDWFLLNYYSFKK